MALAGIYFVIFPHADCQPSVLFSSAFMTLACGQALLYASRIIRQLEEIISMRQRNDNCEFWLMETHKASRDVVLCIERGDHEGKAAAIKRHALAVARYESEAKKITPPAHLNKTS